MEKLIRKKLFHNKTIKSKFALTFIVFMFLALAAIVFVQIAFLTRFYLHEKEKIIQKSWDMINASDDSEVDDNFEKLCSVNGLTYAVTDPNLSIISTNAKDESGMESRLFGNILDKEANNTNVLKKTDQYRMILIHDRFSNMNYLEMWGTLDNENYYIVRTPVESIRVAAKISSRFTLIIGVIVTCLSAVIIWIMTGKLVRPIQDLTEQSKKMADLDFSVHYEGEREDEIGELGKNFNIMSEKLERAVSELKTANVELQKDIDEKVKIDDERKEFIANVSHELKTPIALIQGYAEGLKDGINDGDAESNDFYCDVIIDESAKMNSMVKKLLTLNQLEFGMDKVVMERFDLTELIRGVLQSNKIRIEEKEAKIHFDDSVHFPVWADEFKVEEVVTNYLTNALNHLGGDHNIVISCEEQNGTVTTSVFNNGTPIPEESLDKIWIKFYKVDKARTREYGGSGIGLSIVKAIMDAHGQRCWAENRSDGVVFYFTLESKVNL